MKLLSNKTALITGASRGIGKAIAKKFAEAGSNIAFTFLNNEEKANKLRIDLESYGVIAKCYKCDASNYSDTKLLIEKVLKEFEKIDILVNNAGITKDMLILRMTENEWDAVINTNLKSVFNTTQLLSGHFMKNRKGSIINISSIVGIKGNAGQSNYAASKAGVLGFSKSIALELGSRNIRCNAIAPGWTNTDMTSSLSEKIKEEIIKHIPLKRTGNPEEIANCSLFLASDMSSYITGQVITVDGGLLT